MQRAKSYSKIGSNLDVNLHSATKPKDKEQLQKVLKSKPSIIVKHIKRSKSHHQPTKKQQISHCVPRQTLNSFQKCHTKVQNINAIYNQKIQITKKPHHHFSMKKYNPSSYFETISHWYKKQHEQTDACGKLVKTMKSQNWFKSEQINDKKFHTLSSHSSSKLLIPFEKQTQRPFYQKLQKLQQQSLLKPVLTDQSDVRRQQSLKKQKIRKTHAFSSYSQHDLLNPQKIPKLTSEMNIHEIDPKKYKLKNLAANLKFDRFVDKILTRYDRDCAPWVSKLQYDPKRQTVRKSFHSRDFKSQTERKLNQVHSRYPIRLAM